MQTVPTVSLLVEDHDKAIDFYCNALGLFTVDRDFGFGGRDRNVFLLFHDKAYLMMLCLCKPYDPETIQLIGRQAGPHNYFLGLPVKDADKQLERLNQYSIETDGGVDDLPFGRQIRLKDCFGNLLSLFEDPVMDGVVD